MAAGASFGDDDDAADSCCSTAVGGDGCDGEDEGDAEDDEAAGVDGFADPPETAALIEERPYKRRLDAGEAYDIMRGMTGKLDPALMKEFAHVITCTPLAISA